MRRGWSSWGGGWGTLTGSGCLPAWASWRGTVTLWRHISTAEVIQLGSWVIPRPGTDKVRARGGWRRPPSMWPPNLHSASSVRLLSARDSGRVGSLFATCLRCHLHPAPGDWGPEVLIIGRFELPQLCLLHHHLLQHCILRCCLSSHDDLHDGGDRSGGRDNTFNSFVCSFLLRDNNLKLS